MSQGSIYIFTVYTYLHVGISLISRHQFYVAYVYSHLSSFSKGEQDDLNFGSTHEVRIVSLLSPVSSEL